MRDVGSFAGRRGAARHAAGRDANPLEAAGEPLAEEAIVISAITTAFEPGQPSMGIVSISG